MALRLCCSCAEDLSVYVKALEDCVLRIPPNSLSKVWNGLIADFSVWPSFIHFTEN